jgi:hypothetical protein
VCICDTSFDDEPLRGPILPAGFPSDITKARHIASAKLKKEAQDLSFSDSVQLFSK